MEFRLLGPVEIEVDGRWLDVGRPQRRAVLAALLVDAGRLVTPETLIDRVWGEASPPGARRVLHAHLSHLRRMIPAPLVHRSGGYLLEVDPDTVDLHRFRRLAADPGRVERLREALRLWQGTPLAGLPGEWAARMRQSWARERVDATIVWAGAELRIGRAEATLGPLTELAEEHPLLEPLAAALLRALQAANRSATALEHYAALRERLADELGSDPSPEVLAVHQALLQGGTVGPAQLPPDLSGFVGRAAEIARLDAAAGPVVAIWGTAGVGKSALAVRWATAARGRFPDGQLYVNLRGFDPDDVVASTADVVQGFLEGLGVRPAQIPAGLDAKIGLYRSLLDGRRILVLLDNARDAEQVRPLLPAAANCLAVVTSRIDLTGLVVSDGATGVPLDTFTETEARELFRSRLGAVRADAEPAAVTALIAACARLPLALAVVAARAAARPRQQLAVLAAQLGDSALTALAGGDPRTDPRTVFSWSYRALTPAAARMFRLLGLHPVPELAIAAAASLAGVSMGHAGPLMAELAEANLTAEPRPGRWTVHDLLHSYAMSLVAGDPAEERNAAYRRMFDHYLYVGDAAALLLNPRRDTVEPAPPAAGAVVAAPPDAEAAREWFATEHGTVALAVSLAAAEGFDTHAWQLARSLTTYLNHHSRWTDMTDLHTVGLAAARRAGDRQGQIHTLRDLGLAGTRQGRSAEAYGQFTEALELCAEDQDDLKWGHTHLDLAELVGGQGRWQEAIDHIELAATVYEIDKDGGNIPGMLGSCYAQLGDYDQALMHCQEALALAKKIGDGWTQAATWDSLGFIHHQLGDYGQARECYTNALTLVRETGDRYREADVLDHLAPSLEAAGDLDAARDARHQAEEIRRQTV
ncbi:AfsR/SARP family transcriptional regulator [Paractinoplanes lichenicola]|uniref:Tetratricopeptide repeat protein n=1 Tax=Paractinoplanes lichenicola TaxID=2802976 RepID=A0ABS1VGS2_9ACTN|nr:BTAD domain-containing putative transcriptional regulator [Actinoplanes lichenicola]MBL7253899.1 tetratricopeptide repeat protein [Actinoplanes lichenicola]